MTDIHTDHHHLQVTEGFSTSKGCLLGVRTKDGSSPNRWNTITLNEDAVRILRDHLNKVLSENINDGGQELIPGKRYRVAEDACYVNGNRSLINDDLPEDRTAIFNKMRPSGSADMLLPNGETRGVDPKYLTPVEENDGNAELAKSLRESAEGALAVLAAVVHETQINFDQNEAPGAADVAADVVRRLTVEFLEGEQ